MKEIIIKKETPSGDALTIIRKQYVECVYMIKVFNKKKYYVKTVGGNEYVINEYYYNKIKFMMENK